MSSTMQPVGNHFLHRRSTIPWQDPPASTRLSPPGRVSAIKQPTPADQVRRRWKAGAMANWRERGYVPDSDDEDDGLDSDTHQDDSHGNIISVKTVPAHLPASADETTATDDGTLRDVKDRLTQAVHSLANDNGGKEAATNGSTEPDDGGDAHRQPSQRSDNAPISTAAKLEAEIQKGLKTVHDVLGSLPFPLDSDNDSPLSSVPSSPRSTLRQSPPRGTIRDLLGSSPSLLDSDNFDPPALAIAFADSAARLSPPRDAIAASALELSAPELGVSNSLLLSAVDEAARRRSFRPRAAIQLHPYALEDARYRQAMTARGLKPLRAPEEASNPQKPSGEDTQGTGAYEGSQGDLPEELVRHSSPLLDVSTEAVLRAADEESQSPIRGTRIRHPSPLSDFDDDLPDLLDILKSRTATSDTSKLRKPKRGPLLERRTSKGQPQLYELPDDEPVIIKPSRNRRLSSITPLSPPRSRGGLSSQDGVPVHRVDVLSGNLTPAPLPTPLVSSDKHASKRAFAELFDISDSDNDVTNLSDGIDASSLSEESSIDESQGVQRLRRKIKGVLPASWLKLDMKQADKPARGSRQQMYSPVKSGLERGIAKHLSSSGRRVRESGVSHAFEPDVADSSTSSDSDVGYGAVADLEDVQPELPEVFEEENMEDNAVDAMLAPRARNSHVGKKQQSFSTLRPRTGSKQNRARRLDPTVAARLKATPQPRKKVKRRHRKPQMTILDAPGFEEQDVPRFLRIAARRVGKTSTVRKQDPALKFLRLATLRDTQDMNEGMRRWRRRQGQAVDAVESVPSRSPLVPQPRGYGTINKESSTTSARDYTRPQNVDNLEPQLTALKQTTNATLHRIQKHRSRNLSPAGQPPASLAGQPPVILDYFRPQNSRRSQLDPSNRPRRVEPGTAEHDHPATVQANAFALLKRVPQSANAKRRQTNPPVTFEAPSTRATAQSRSAMPGTSGKRDLSPSSPDLHLSRPPKKQQPVGLRDRDDDAINPRDLLCLQSLQLDDDKDIITNAIRYSPVMSTILSASTPAGVEPVRSRLLRVTISSMADLTGLFESGFFENTITTPKSRRTLEATGWTLEVEAIITDSLQEIVEITCEDVATSHLDIRTRKNLLDNAASSVETIITYVNESLTFSTEQELGTFLQLAVDFTEKIWRGIAECEAATSDPHAPYVLKILNGLLVLGYQVEQLATVRLSAETARTKISGSRKNLARLAWELALREEHIGQLFAHLAAPASTDSTLTRPARYAAEVETIFFVHTLGPHQGWAFYMRNILFTDGSGGEMYRLQSRAESIACAVLVLGCILSIAGPEGLSAHHWVQTVAPLGVSLRSTLLNRLSEFILPYIELRSKYAKRFQNYSLQVEKLGQFGLAMFRWCFLLAQTFLPELADDLLKTMFKHYSETGMVELFVPPISAEQDRMPRFITDQTLSKDLVPEDTDTDFHIFLKLTATTLTAQPPPDCETAEHARKLNLRKSSLMFLLLPNKGRDLVVESLSLFEEDKDLAITDFVGMANRYSLFATLYHYAPTGFKPVLSQISNYLDFPTAHDRVREVILGFWASLVKSVLSQCTNGAGLEQLGQWIRQMFFSMCDKLAKIPRANNNSFFQDEVMRAQYHVHQINREMTISCLCRIAARYTAAVDLCVSEDQVSRLLPHEELSSLMLRCYVDQGLGNAVVRQVFNLLTVYIQKGLEKERGALVSFRRDLRGVIVDLLTRNKEQDEIDLSQLLVSMTEAWYALGKAMVNKGDAHWDQYLNGWSPMSFTQIADVENAKHCQVLLMSKIASERSVILADPYPFVHLLLHSILEPVGMGSKISFVHRLLNQLMENTPDAYGFDALRQKLSNGVNPFFLDQFDIVNHRFAIIDHFIRWTYVLRVAAEGPLVGNLKNGQWNDLMTLIPVTLKRCLKQVFGETQRDWIAFSQKVLFRLCLYRGPSIGSEKWLTEVNEGEIETNVFKLERLFVCFPNQDDSNRHDLKQTAAKVLRSVLETAYLKNKEILLVPHLVNIFAAAELDYVDDDGSFLLDVDQQFDFLKAVFPVYIEAAFDLTQPTMQFTLPVIDVATGVLERLEARVDLESQARMESFAELIAVLTRATIKAMQRVLACRLKEGSWQIETVRRLVDLCSLGGGRWAHLHQLFPSSAGVLAVQPFVQAYAYYAYEYACSAVGFDMGERPLNPAFWEVRNALGRWKADFGFEVEEISLSEQIIALKDAAANDLKVVARDWHQVGLTANEPVWELRRGALPAMARDQGGVVGGTTLVAVEEAVARLRRVLVLLGVVEEVL